MFCAGVVWSKGQCWDAVGGCGTVPRLGHCSHEEWHGGDFFPFFSSQAYLWPPCWSSVPHSEFIFLQEEGKQTALFFFGWVFLMLQKITSVPFLVTNVQISYLPVLTQLNKLNCCGQCWLSLNVPQLSFSSFSHQPGYNLLIFSTASMLFGIWSLDTITSAVFVVYDPWCLYCWSCLLCLAFS